VQYASARQRRGDAAGEASSSSWQWRADTDANTEGKEHVRADERERKRERETLLDTPMELGGGRAMGSGFEEEGGEKAEGWDGREDGRIRMEVDAVQGGLPVNSSLSAAFGMVCVCVCMCICVCVCVCVCVCTHIFTI